MKKKQNGFAAIESVLIIVIIVVIGGTGWYVWHSKKVADKLTAITASKASEASWKTYSDPKYHLSFSYPASWIVLAGDSKSLTAFASRSDVALHSIYIESTANITAPSRKVYIVAVSNDSLDDMMQVARNGLLSNGIKADFKTTSLIINGREATQVTASTNGKVIGQDLYFVTPGLVYDFYIDAVASRGQISGPVPENIIKSLTITN